VGGGLGAGDGLGVGGAGGVGVGAGVGAGAGRVTGGCLSPIRSPATVTVAIRSGPVLGATVTRTAPSPRPDSGDTEIHAASLDAVHAQRACARTSTVDCPPAAAICKGGAETWKRQSAASCETSICRSATVMDPRRAAGSAFSPTRYAIAPSPCPSTDEVSAIHPDEVDALQEHSRATAIERLPVPPDAEKELLEFDTLA
jgi:hypothetical protein